VIRDVITSHRVDRLLLGVTDHIQDPKNVLKVNSRGTEELFNSLNSGKKSAKSPRLVENCERSMLDLGRSVTDSWSQKCQWDVVCNCDITAFFWGSSVTSSGGQTIRPILVLMSRGRNVCGSYPSEVATYVWS
jgi:hypothetical protein